MSEAFFSAEDLRIDHAGVPVIDGLTFSSQEQRVAVLGADRALFEAAAGIRPASRGALTIQGVEASRALTDGATAAAPLDPPMPPHMSVRDYVIWSARLHGQSAGDARDGARRVLEALELTPLAKSKLSAIAPAARRAVVLAAALVTRAESILFEEFTSSVEPEAANSLVAVVLAALEGRSWIYFASRLVLASPFAAAVEEALVIHGSELELQASPAELSGLERSFLLRVLGDPELFLARMREEGATLELRERSLVAHLSDQQTTAHVARAASATGVSILELVPLSRRIA